MIEVGVTERDDPITELIAKAIVNVTWPGERDPKESRDAYRMHWAFRGLPLNPDKITFGFPLCYRRNQLAETAKSLIVEKLF